jgi:hypothetical protein
MELITTLEACQLLIGAKHYYRFRSMCLRMKYFPQPVIKRGAGQPNRYNKAEIIEYGKNHNALRLMNNAYVEYRKKWQESKESQSLTQSINENNLFIQFMRGDYDTEYRRLIKNNAIRRARENQPETTRVSVYFEDWAA